MVCYPMQAMQKAGLCGSHSPTRLLVLSPTTLSDVLESILKVRRSSLASGMCLHPLLVQSQTRQQHPAECAAAQYSLGLLGHARLAQRLTWQPRPCAAWTLCASACVRLPALSPA